MDEISNPVEAAREVLLNGVAAFDFDAYETALDRFEAAIRSEIEKTVNDFARIVVERERAESAGTPDARSFAEAARTDNPYKGQEWVEGAWREGFDAALAAIRSESAGTLETWRRTSDKGAAPDLPKMLLYDPMTGDGDFQYLTLEERLKRIVEHHESIGFHRGFRYERARSMKGENTRLKGVMSDPVETALKVLWDFTYQSGPAPTGAELKAEAALQVIEAAIRSESAGTLDVERLRRERDDAATEDNDYYRGMVVAYDRVLARLSSSDTGEK